MKDTPIPNRRVYKLPLAITVKAIRIEEKMLTKNANKYSFFIGTYGKRYFTHPITFKTYITLLNALIEKLSQ